MVEPCTSARILVRAAPAVSSPGVTVSLGRIRGVMHATGLPDTTLQLSSCSHAAAFSSKKSVGRRTRLLNLSLQASKSAVVSDQAFLLIQHAWNTVLSTHQLAEHDVLFNPATTHPA